MNANNAVFRHLLGKVRDAKQGGLYAWEGFSTGEKLAVALVLNKSEWIGLIDYTLAEAIDRLEPEWLAAIPAVERALKLS